MDNQPIISSYNGGDRMKNIVRVHRPTLTVEEREAQMKLIADAAARLVVAAAQVNREATKNERF